MEENEEQPAAVETLKAKRNWGRLALYLFILLLALLAIAGVIMAAVSSSVDPASVTPPVITAKMIDQDQKTLETPVQVPVAVKPAVAPQGPEGAETEDEPVIEQTDAPLQLPSEGKQSVKPLVPLKKSPAPQSMIKWKEPVAKATIPEMPVAKINGKVPQIVIVIDDMGLNQKNSRIMASMDPVLTLSYMPYAEHLQDQVKTAYNNGHELIVHMPMEPDDIKHNNPGPDALLTTNTAEENVARLNRNFAKFNGYVIGMNNHMGSRMTASDTGMRPILEEFKKKNLWFLDSRTIGNSVGGKIAGQLGVPYAERDVFLDNSENVGAILAQLKVLESVSRRKGYAVAIGHPYTQTIEALKQWLPQARAQGFKLIPLSTIIAERFPAAAIPKYARTERNLSVASH